MPIELHSLFAIFGKKYEFQTQTSYKAKCSEKVPRFVSKIQEIFFQLYEQEPCSERTDLEENQLVLIFLAVNRRYQQTPCEPG